MPLSYGCLGKQKLVIIAAVKIVNSLVVNYNEMNSYLNYFQLKTSRVTVFYKTKLHRATIN